MFRQIRSKLLAAFAVPLAILVAVVAVEASLSLALTNGSKSPHSGVATEAIAFAALGLVGAMIGLVLVIRVSRSVSSSLVDLAQQAEKLATETLPDTVQAILEAGATGDDLPEVPQVQVDSVDEVAAVASALETLKVTALDLAIGQAALRRNLADAFVNLGRRNQNLVTRQLEYITEIELKEADPTSLEELFRLDHLATRMRRNAESLLILAGSGPARQWSASVPVMDVARAASAEVEDYKRLRLHHFDHALVTGAVTTDLVHILAELIENALSFSPPGSPVDVYGRTLEGGYVIVVVDSGIGMSAEDLETANRRLEGQGTNGEVPGRYLGHFVAGRLAARNGIAISLQSSHSGGLVSRVKVPSSVVEEPAPDLSAPADVASAQLSAAEAVPPEVPLAEVPLAEVPSAELPSAEVAPAQLPAAGAVPSAAIFSAPVPEYEFRPAPVAAEKGIVGTVDTFGLLSDKSENGNGDGRTGVLYDWAGERTEAAAGDVGAELGGHDETPPAPAEEAVAAGLEAATPEPGERSTWPSDAAASPDQTVTFGGSEQVPSYEPADERADQLAHDPFGALSPASFATAAAPGAEVTTDLEAGAVVEHSWDPILAQKSHSGSQEPQSDEADQYGDTEPERPSWVSWGSSFDTGLETGLGAGAELQPESTAQAGPSGSSARSGSSPLGTPDFNALAPLAAPAPGLNGNHFRPGFLRPAATVRANPRAGRHSARPDMKGW